MYNQVQNGVKKNYEKLKRFMATPTKHCYVGSSAINTSNIIIITMITDGRR